MGKNSKSDDNTLFRDSVGEVQPVSTRRLHLTPPPPRARARFRRLDEADVMAESLRRVPEPWDLEAGDELSFARPQVAYETLRKLRRGRFAVRAEMDLHGMTSGEARAALREFIDECIDERHFCVRVIHGKGLRSGQRGPVLKSSVNRWLRQWDEVLAFCSAPARDGGTGAIYLLIRG
ncbi:MAG: Smr/MutS family protein [Chromatiales bacterium]|nr:Smr/MutS family protein [Chromatiales bacterium]